jgi:ATP-dependent Lhr-like helicase
VSLWESEVLPRRVPGYRPELLDQLCATGEVVWVGSGLDRVALFFREDASVLGRPAGAAAPEGERTTASARRWRAAPSSGRTCWRAPASSPSPLSRRCGTSSGRAR